ncbi:MAG: STAS domain-containing protein [Desulfobacteraceae bacterium]|jgi:anti-sigma B factor antagonist
MAGTRKKTTKKTIKPGKDIIESMVEDFKAKLIKIINQDIKELVIDMKNVNDIDSTGVGVLIAVKNSLDQTGGQLNLKNVSEKIESMLRILGLDVYFNLSAT